ncbi:MAG: nuclease [Rhodovulum sulfidophilum]|uniref:Nuclease n=1 Tax=Rhodovulum sulfidophilum TaxID=35806 RepID=A0A2W5N5Y3_RHOSU|nr:MAG: nuclease [Rhodovulum sulfidophilum]
MLDNLLDTPYALEDTSPELDERIQNLDFREDTVLDDVAPELTAIYDLQGAGQVAPSVLAASGFSTVAALFNALPEGETSLAGAEARTSGVVTALDTNGFYLQDPEGDGNIATSDAIFVFTGAAPAVAVGDAIEVAGTLSEYFPGGTASRNLPTTQIGDVTEITVTSSGNALPEAVIIGASGRVLPTENIEDDAFIAFNPTTSGADFSESLEGMQVTLEDAVAVAGTNGFGEVYAVANQGAGATGLSERGTLNISPDDFNPERVQIDPDSGVLDLDVGGISTGDKLGDVTGVLGYGFGNYEIVPTEDFTGNVVSGGLTPETSDLKGGCATMTFASYNVLNLDPNDMDGDTDVLDFRFMAVAEQIVDALNAPDVIALQEVQDNSGATDDGTTSASTTLELLSRWIDVADDGALNGSLTYEWIDNPFIGDNTSGGEPGGNIRTAYLYRSDRVDLVEDSLRTIDGQGEGHAFEETRAPLVADFAFKGETVTVVNNHFSSKGGSAPIIGTEQPFEARQEDPTVNGGVDARHAQAAAVAGFVAGELGADADANLVVLGDFNEFEFVSPLTGLEAAGLTNLTNTLPEDERYTYAFDGNSQAIDHILVSDNLKGGARYDAVHVNSEFATDAFRASDHDPVLAALRFGEAEQLVFV